jgi:hypothetical protein
LKKTVPIHKLIFAIAGCSSICALSALAVTFIDESELATGSLIMVFAMLVGLVALWRFTKKNEEDFEKVVIDRDRKALMRIIFGTKTNINEERR